MDKPVPNIYLFKRGDNYTSNRIDIYSEKDQREKLIVSLRTKALAISFFLYFFIESGTLGLFPKSAYIIYRNVRISDIIQYGLIIYSFLKIKEYKYLFKSKSFLVTKIILFYLLFEFVLSCLRYEINPIEYFFRLKGVWSSFLVFPFLLLFKRNGFPFLIKLLLPVSIISNVLYILSAITGIPFLPDISINTQYLASDLQVYRVYGGTFFGELFFLGYIYFWITKRFRLYQFFLTILFIIPHILAFGRLAWAYLLFTIVLMVVHNSLKKREFKIFLRQSIILVTLLVGLLVFFIKIIPSSDYYFDALYERFFEGQEDVKYDEGTYGQRVVLQNNVLIQLWLNGNWLVGVGMHPMWVIGAESHEEQVIYNSFSDVTWTGVLAAYGAIGFSLAAFFQIYYILLTYRLSKKYNKSDLISFLVILTLSKLLFDSCIAFSYVLLSFGLWGLNFVNFYVAATVFAYEKLKNKRDNKISLKK